MPNHVHAIVVLEKGRTIQLGVVVNLFKGAVTRRAREIARVSTAIWQRGYYETIIRDRRHLKWAREYINA